MGYVELVFRREGRFLRWCARKRLHEPFRNDLTFRSMFMDEARLAGLVRHPNAVGVLDVGEDDDGPFLIMDFVEGVSLSRLIVDAVNAGRLISMQVAVRICMDAAQGLHAAHEVRAEDGTVLHLVHRDVSPQNILIGFDGTVRVTDFGIAKALGNSSRTSAGVLKGNMGYLAPEQLRFEELDRRSDFFSLGVTLYELLSGIRLYPNKTGFDGTRRILTEPPPDIGEVRSDVPPELCELLFEMLAKERDSRPATAVEIASRLEGILAVLIAEEGSVTVGDYMSQHFAQQCQEQRAILAAHLKRVESEPLPALRSIPGAVLAVDAPLALQPLRRRGARGLLPGLLVGAAVITAVGAWWVGVRLNAPAAPSDAVPARSSIVERPAPGAAKIPVGIVRLPAADSSPPPGDVAKTAVRALPSSSAARDHRKLAKRIIHHPRRGDPARNAAEPKKTPIDPNRLAVPLFERWQ
jgi:hypothetical protein